MSDTRTNPELSRRGLLAGLGAAGAAGAGLMIGAEAANAAVPQTKVPSAVAGPRTSPVASTLASPLIPGHQYVVRGEWDFTTEDGTAQRTFGTKGLYSAVTPSELWTTVDLPAGAQVFDIEWYVYNASTGPVVGQGRLWRPVDGYLTSVVADVSIPVDTSGVRATRTTVPAAGNGPYPTATKLMLGVFTLTDATIQVNGVRVGFTNAPMGTVLLPTPVRVYDSRAHTPIKSSQVRAASLGKYLPDGASGAIVTVTVLSTHGAGTLAVGANGMPGSTAVVRWGRTGDSALGQTATRVSTGQNISVRSRPGSGATHYTLDLVGYLV